MGDLFKQKASLQGAAPSAFFKISRDTLLIGQDNFANLCYYSAWEGKKVAFVWGNLGA